MWKRGHYILLLHDENTAYPATMVYWVYKTLLCCFHTTTNTDNILLTFTVFLLAQDAPGSIG